MFEDRWCERWWVGSVAGVAGVNLGEDEGHSFGVVCSISVAGTAGFEGQTDVFAATWDAGPVDQFVGGVFRALLAF